MEGFKILKNIEKLEKNMKFFRLNYNENDNISYYMYYGEETDIPKIAKEFSYMGYLESVSEIVPYWIVGYTSGHEANVMYFAKEEEELAKKYYINLEHKIKFITEINKEIDFIYKEEKEVSLPWEN